MNTFSIGNCQDIFTTFDFVYHNQIIQTPVKCGMTLKKAGSMRFRWNETNPLRDETLATVSRRLSINNSSFQIAPVELIHSKIVYKADSFEDVKNLTGDGIISNQSNLMAVVTVADCMPLFIYDKGTHSFSVVHSGWKGTGIVINAIEAMKKEFGTKIQDVCVILGPHINDCCYIVNEERRNYFATEFCKECVKPLEEGGKCFCGGKGLKIDWDNGQGPLYRLSLKEANLFALKKYGIDESNINVCTDCTCCSPVFGSNRRETAEGTNFTVQAAFIVKPEC